MIKNDEMINVYNDYDSNIYAPSVDPKGIDLVFPRKDEFNEPYIISLPFAEIKNIHRLDRNVFPRRILRFEDDMEDEVFGALNIRLDREKETFTREDIEDMILNPNDDIIKTILTIKDKGTIDRFVSQLVYLKNTNKYFIPTKVEEYIRARKEELEEGIKESDLEGQPTENVSAPSVNVEVETGDLEKEEVVESKPKEKRAKSTATRKKNNEK